MDIAILLYDGFTALDAIGPYQVLVNLPGASLRFVAVERGEVRTDTRVLGVTADAAIDEVERADILVVPGGPGEAIARTQPEVLDFVRRIDATSTWTTSVCTGSLILGQAGLLQGKRATSHWTALEALRSMGAEPTLERVVFDGKIVTAAGVSAGIDMGLHLAARIAGDTVAQAIQLGIEYDPQPPFDSGSPEKAPAAIVDLLRSRSRFESSGATTA